MKKKIILGTIIVLLIGMGVFISLSNPLFTGQIINNQGLRSSTIAICDKNNYCEDYEIVCEGSKTIKTTTTGFSIQQGKNWIDPREKQKENLCE